MTKEPTHLAAGNELKSGILPGGIVSETGPRTSHQLFILLENQDADGRFASGPQGLRTAAKSPSGLEDDAGYFEIYAVEKSGALADWVVRAVLGNAIHDEGRNSGAAGRHFNFTRHHTGITAREQSLLEAIGIGLQNHHQNNGRTVGNEHALCKAKEEESGHA